MQNGKTQSEMLWEAMWAWIVANDPQCGKSFYLSLANSAACALRCACRSRVVDWDGGRLSVNEAVLETLHKPSGLKGFTADYRESDLRSDVAFFNTAEMFENVFHAAGYPVDRITLIEAAMREAGRDSE